jgi:hypothetical protein
MVSAYHVKIIVLSVSDQINARCVMMVFIYKNYLIVCPALNFVEHVQV